MIRGSVGVFHGAAEIQNAQQEKYERLHQGDENTHGHDGQWRQKGPGQNKQNRQHKFMPHHVSEKPERKRQHPGDMADNLDGHDDGNHPPDRSHEMFDIGGRHDT